MINLLRDEVVALVVLKELVHLDNVRVILHEKKQYRGWVRFFHSLEV